MTTTLPSHTRSPLPAIGDRYITDGGLETDLIFNHGMKLRAFASFELLNTEEGKEQLAAYYLPYLRLAEEHGYGFILESPTWRSNTDWGLQLGYSTTELDNINQQAISFCNELRAMSSLPSTLIAISGCIGPRGDGYVVDEVMSVSGAAKYHKAQIASFIKGGADCVSAFTMTTWQEAAGIATAAQQADIPAVISFTVETDGRLPSGQHLGDAIEAVDNISDTYPSYYMINCAHPLHFDSTLVTEDAWLQRIGGIRANASRCSHAELDEATELDDGDPNDLAHRCTHIAKTAPAFRVIGGCCGTDLRHIEAMALRYR